MYSIISGITVKCESPFISKRSHTHTCKYKYCLALKAIRVTMFSCRRQHKLCKTIHQKENDNLRNRVITILSKDKGGKTDQWLRWVIQRVRFLTKPNQDGFYRSSKAPNVKPFQAKPERCTTMNSFKPKENALLLF